MLSPIEGLGWNSLSDLTGAPFEKVAESFEAVFISQLVRSMRESLCKDFGVGGGLGTDDYLFLIDQALSEAIARAGGIGIREQLEAWAGSEATEKDSSKQEVSKGLHRVRSVGRF